MLRQTYKGKVRRFKGYKTTFKVCREMQTRETDKQLRSKS